MEGAGVISVDGDGKLKVGKTLDVANYEWIRKGMHSLWCRATACIFDIQVTYLDSKSHQGASLAKVMANQEWDKNEGYQAMS